MQYVFLITVQQEGGGGWSANRILSTLGLTCEWLCASVKCHHKLQKVFPYFKLLNLVSAKLCAIPRSVPFYTIYISCEVSEGTLVAES